MSGPNIFSRKPKLWIGAGIAVVAIVLVARYFDFPPGMDTQGTIAPAKRAVAEQPGAGDVNSGQSDASRSTLPATGNAAGDGASQSGGRNDGGSQSGGRSDGGSQSGGRSDGGSQSGGRSDGGSQSGGRSDGGSQSGGRNDAGRNDAGRNDAGRNDARSDASSQR